MLSFEECKKILTENGGTYTNEEIKSIKELLTEWATLHAEQLLKPTIENEESSINGTGIQR